MDSKITVLRSRNIWWSLILQNTSQLTAKYGRHTAEVIKDNCSLHIFLQSLSQSTLQEYSNKLGKQTKVFNTYSKTKKSNSWSSSIRAVELMSDTELMHLPRFNGVVINSKDYPYKTKFTPIYKFNKYVKKSLTVKAQNQISDQEFEKDYFYNLLSKKDAKLKKFDKLELNEVLREKEKIENEILAIENHSNLVTTKEDLENIANLYIILETINQRIVDLNKEELVN